MRNPTHRHGVSPDDMAEIILLDSPGVSPGRVFNRLFQDARHPSHMPPGGDNQPLKHGGATETRRFPDCTRRDQLVIITGAKCLEMNRITLLSGCQGRKIARGAKPGAQLFVALEAWLRVNVDRKRTRLNSSQ